ncbi:putative transcriptional regulatory protein [Salinisphaera shabanensis E1L3A]|jgi:AcrR family transcriptional regulator|uniref:Transcriptional regulatory protein n=1 Tax=Salinisphaera shabanensis E1L3A TaxID=1033802 RepID=F7Q4D8_9GAMM|nr:TetR/AcrR family transcriptional regulator [Salinisphaera shabanensis]ERJ17457.1 putative transcriptional regulatory protein [Salinisphaera shabanensis E1L3A]
MAGTPQQADNDLTAKARIRNAALALYADFGEDATAMRAIAEAAGVTVGLVVHHFRTKDGLREAIEQHILGLFSHAIDQAPLEGTAAAIAAARDEAVASMLARNPAVIGYLRRAVLDPTGHRGRILEMLTRLAADRVKTLRSAGVASVAQRDTSQTIGVMVRQLGQLFLQPMVDSMWAQLAGPDEAEHDKPHLVVKVHEPGAPGS